MSIHYLDTLPKLLASTNDDILLVSKQRRTEEWYEKVAEHLTLYPRFQLLVIEKYNKGIEKLMECFSSIHIKVIKSCELPTMPVMENVRVLHIEHVYLNLKSFPNLEELHAFSVKQSELVYHPNLQILHVQNFSWYLNEPFPDNIKELAIKNCNIITDDSNKYESFRLEYLEIKNINFLNDDILCEFFSLVAYQVDETNIQFHLFGFEPLPGLPKIKHAREGCIMRVIYPELANVSKKNKTLVEYTDLKRRGAVKEGKIGHGPMGPVG